MAPTPTRPAPTMHAVALADPGTSPGPPRPERAPHKAQNRIFDATPAACTRSRTARTSVAPTQPTSPPSQAADADTPHGSRPGFHASPEPVAHTAYTPGNRSNQPPICWGEKYCERGCRLLSFEKTAWLQGLRRVVLPPGHLTPMICPPGRWRMAPGVWITSPSAGCAEARVFGVEMAVERWRSATWARGSAGSRSLRSETSFTITEVTRSQPSACGVA